MDYNTEAKRIINLIKAEFLLENGIPFLEKEDDRILKCHILPDLGDYLPFFIHYKEYDFVESQIKAFESLAPKGLLVSEFPTFHLRGLAKSYEYTDLLLGLIAYYKHKRDEYSRKLLQQTLETAIRIFRLDGRISSFYMPKFHLHFPITDTRDGSFIEILVEIAELLEEPRYVSIAQSIYELLISVPFYRKHGLLPTFFLNLPIFLPLFNRAVICKNNTNSLFAMLALYKKIKDKDIVREINRIIDSLEDKAAVSGFGIEKEYIPGNDNKEAFLTPSFSIIDFLCDLFCEVKDKIYLDKARKIADFWIARQGKTGLFPHYSNGKESFIDSETDMVVALTKLWELTGVTKYKEAGDKCFDGLITYHAKQDYVLGVDCDNGSVINGTQRTKFITLFLKLLIAKDMIAKCEKITQNAWLSDILKDR